MGLHPKVVLLSRSVLAPYTPTSPVKAHLFLSCLDIMWQDIHYDRRILFYQSVAPVADAVEILKRSLSQVLVHYYPCAGRLAIDDNKRLYIDCNDAGAEFVEASTDLGMSDLHSRGFQMDAFYDKLCQNVDHKDANLYRSPLLSVQVTRFSDGGLAVAVAMSHVAADGQSLWNFMVSWGECARGAKLSVEPVHDRRRLALENPSQEKSTLNFLAKKLDDDDEEEVGPDVAIENGQKLMAINAQEDGLLQCLFILPGSAVRKLKIETGGFYSSYAVMCAHFWQHITAARASPSSTSSAHATLANLRSRLSPPLPPSYFGNVITFGASVSSARKIRSEKFSRTAARVHAAIAASQDVHNIIAMMHWLELNDNSLRNAPRASGERLNIASSPRFPAYQVDFGWAVPSAVRPAKVMGDGEMVLFGGNPDLASGDIEVCTCLKSSALKRLLQDTEFLAHTPVSPFVDLYTDEDEQVDA